MASLPNRLPGLDFCLGESADMLRSTVEGYKTEIAAHVFTDNQKSSLPAAFSDLKLDDGTKLVMHPVVSAALPMLPFA